MNYRAKSAIGGVASFIISEAISWVGLLINDTNPPVIFVIMSFIMFIAAINDFIIALSGNSYLYWIRSVIDDTYTKEEDVERIKQKIADAKWTKKDWAQVAGAILVIRLIFWGLGSKK